MILVNRPLVNESDGDSVPPPEDGPVIMRKGKAFFKTTVELDREKVELFRIYFPQHGALKEFLNNALNKFVEIYEPTVDRDLNTAVMDTVEEMRERVEESDANG